MDNRLGDLYARIVTPSFEGRLTRMCALSPAHMERALELAVTEFGRFIDPAWVRPTLRFVRPSLSFGIEADGALIGAYLVSDNRLKFGRIPVLAGRPALHGEALIVDPRARGRGYGTILRATLAEVAMTVGADYVWGAALVELDNLNHWLRRRVLVERRNGLNVTVEPIAPALKEALLPLAGEHLRDQWMREIGLRPSIYSDPSRESPGP